ncbi:hypothetical protein ES288_A07G137500v1 [Gossypium darwinii]|uniref:Nucleolar protein 10-like second domain-containing protein n=3 Tax=Gossypium TaxID=3633 RepID=A0A5D2FXA6_GOSDA|nr:hypothetical protein ES288_A07G137500v1 [Gossypium darwinii]
MGNLDTLAPHHACVCYIASAMFAKFHLGLMLLAFDASQIPAYFIPALGPVLKWCSSLESLTEELEGGQTSIYDNYKFLTKEDLEKLNLTNLIGTNLLRAYMHGFFIDFRLYKKARLLFFLLFLVKDIMQLKNSG